MTRTPASKKTLVADLRFVEETPTAEIRTTHDSVEVCFFHPGLAPNDAECQVTPYTFRINKVHEYLLIFQRPNDEKRAQP